MEMKQYDIKPGLQGRLQTTLETQPLFLTVNPKDRKGTNYKSINWDAIRQFILALDTKLSATPGI